MRTRSVENCRLTHPAGLVGNALTSLSIFHTLMTRQRKAAQGAKGDGDGAGDRDGPGCGRVRGR